MTQKMIKSMKWLKRLDRNDQGQGKYKIFEY